MDLVEIRKKAKSRKPRKKKAREIPENSIEEVTPVEERPSVSVEDQVTPEPGDFSTETGSVEEGVLMDNKKTTTAGEVGGTSDNLKSLDDVLMSQREEVKDEEEEQLQLLTFMLGGEEYALNIMDIKEIIRPKEVTEVPRTPDYILGILSLRGTIIPVFDVSLRLGLPRGERGPRNRIVVVKSREHLFGLHVDSVVQVLDIPLDNIEPPPEILGGVEGEFLRGIGRIDDRLLILLNLDRILKLDEGENSEHLELPSGESDK